MVTPSIAFDLNKIQNSHDPACPDPVAIALILASSPWPETVVDILPMESMQQVSMDQIRSETLTSPTGIEFVIDVDVPGGTQGYLRGFAISIKGQKRHFGEICEVFDSAFGSPTKLFGVSAYASCVTIRKTFRGIQIGFRNPRF